MKKILLSFCLMLASVLAWANPVSYQTAVKVAESFATSQGISIEANPVVNLTPEGMFRQLYFFGFDGAKGFVIVAADDRVIPILGYSLEDNFSSTDMPKHVYEWFKDYSDQIDCLVANNVEPTEQISNAWNNLTAFARPVIVVPIVDPLVTTKWNQDSYYNNLCPLYNSINHCLTGCVATATAQIMKFWNHPSSGTGLHSYTWNNKTHIAIFSDQTYDWANMPTSLNSSSTIEQILAVSTLMYHVGVALEMEYGPSRSGANVISEDLQTISVETILPRHFRYSDNIRHIKYEEVTDAEWKNILKNELNAGRPMIYQGFDGSTGHAFVCDGYLSGDYFHFNWGWGGIYDGYFAIGQLNPNYHFNNNNAVVLGIQPYTGALPRNTQVTAVPDDPAHGYVSGSGSYRRGCSFVLKATPHEAYTFSRWDDDSRSNPRYVCPNSFTYKRTAYFDPLPTDTLHFCDNNFASGIAAGSNTKKWGFRYPASALPANRLLTIVQMYSVVAGRYTVKLYQGDGNQMRVVYSQTFSTSRTQCWVNFKLASQYSIDNTKSLWVTLEYSGSGCPMSYSSYERGNDNGLMWFNGTSWGKYNYPNPSLIPWLVPPFGSWMIKAVTIPSSNANRIIAKNSEAVNSAEAFVNMNRLCVENLVEGTHVTIINAEGKTLYSNDADNTHIEFELLTRGVYLVVLSGKQEQTLKLVY